MVKTLGREDAEVARLAEKAFQLRQERIRIGTLRAAFEPVFEAIPALGIILLIAVGSWRVSTGAISVGTLVQFVSLFELLAFPLRLIGFVLSDVPRAVVGRARVQDVFDEPITLSPAVGGSPVPGGPCPSRCATWRSPTTSIGSWTASTSTWRRTSRWPWS